MTGYTTELYALERDYARALASGNVPEIERRRDALSEKHDEWGRTRYGKHYTGAISASIEVTERWFEQRRDGISDADLQKYVAGYVARHGVNMPV